MARCLPTCRPQELILKDKQEQSDAQFKKEKEEAQPGAEFRSTQEIQLVMSKEQSTTGNHGSNMVQLFMVNMGWFISAT